MFVSKTFDSRYDSSAFKTLWKVKAGEELGFITAGDFIIDWGDGCTDPQSEKMSHVYADDGEYTVSVGPGVKQLQVIDWENDAVAHRVSKDCLLEIKQWGYAEWEKMSHMFRGAVNMICTATDKPNTSKVKKVNYMFEGCENFNSQIDWDLRALEDIQYMLWGAKKFNQNLTELKVNPKLNTDDMFGYDKSLNNYNKKYARLNKTEILENLEKIRIKKLHATLPPVGML